MRAHLHVLFPVVAVGIPLAIACGGTDSGDTGSPPVEATGPGGDTTGPDGTTTGPGGTSTTPGGPTTPPAAGVGDPCRGMPMPAGQFFSAKDVCASVAAKGVSSLRQIMFTSNGDLWGVGAGGAIYKMVDADDDGFYQSSEIKQYASTNGNGNNVHVDEAGGYMYAGTSNGVSRWPWSPTATTGGDAEVVISDQPSGGSHPKHTVHVYDGWLYVHSGSAGNMVAPKGTDYDDARSLIKRFKLSDFTPGTPLKWASGEVVTSGLRNANGFTRNAAGRMYAVVNGLDDITYGGTNVHNDNPGEQVLEIAAGKHYGYPFCFTAQRVNSFPAGTQLVNEQLAGGHDDGWCATNSDKPATFIQAHSAPLDITFFDAQPTGGLPDRFRGGAFVALHGSWDRSPNTGYKVIWIPFDASGNAPMPTSTATETTFPYETVFGGGDASGAQDGAWSYSSNGYADQPRFAGVAVGPIDGALYASSDSGGYLYRLGKAK